MAQILTTIFLTFNLIYANENFKVKSYQELRFTQVIKQKYEDSCGASSLATLMNLYEGNMTEEDLIVDINTTNMLSFEDLRSLSAKHNYIAKGYKVSEAIFENLELPVIARVVRHRNYPHFIIIQKLKGDYFLSMDPIYGKRLISKSEFYKIWFDHDGGYILIVVPDKSKKPMQHNVSLENFSLLRQ